MRNTIEKIRSALTPVTVHAHCDIPCGIYDPAGAVLAAKTVARMVELITATEIGGPADHVGRNKVARCIAVKEEHAELVKREVQVIWSDYFKPRPGEGARSATTRSGAPEARLEEQAER